MYAVAHLVPYRKLKHPYKMLLRCYLAIILMHTVVNLKKYIYTFFPHPLAHLHTHTHTNTHTGHGATLGSATRHQTSCVVLWGVARMAVPYEAPWTQATATSFCGVGHAHRGCVQHADLF